MNLQKACQNISNKNPDVLSVILIGSRARGDFRKDSDYDLMFITRKGKKYELSKNYNELISKKTNIDEDLLSIHLWTSKEFNKQYINGNSFIYCAIRDGKILYNNYHLIRGAELPNCKVAGYERLRLAKRNVEFIEYLVKNRKYKNFSGLELEELGYCAMHLCWAVCMINNFCPVSKYTALSESKKYFSGKEFKIIKKAYGFYANQDISLEINRTCFIKLYNRLKQIIRRLNKTGTFVQEIRTENGEDENKK